MLTTVVEIQSKNAMHLSVQTSVSILVSLRSARSAAKEAHITSQTKRSLNVQFMKNIFTQRNISYNLSHGDDAQLPKVRTTPFGFESIPYLGNKLWQHLPQEIKQSSSLPFFQQQIRYWNGGKCNCRLCKVCIQKV